MAANREDQEENKDRYFKAVHGNKTLLQSEKLYEYILETSVYPREPQCLKEIRELTYKHPLSPMMTSPDEAQFFSMLLKLINAKNTMEIGVFTGYSLLATALAIPDDGKILALDITKEHYEKGLPIIQKAGVAHKIDFREGPALPLLDQLIQHEKYHGTFDFVFVDADKDNYVNYHKRLIELVKVGGVIGYDNTLWGGSVVAPPDADLDEHILYLRDFVQELNKALAVDPRIEICQLSIADGVTLCRRIG
ncbi:Caffeoyl-CoA O-methyltransferase 1 [Citrus sinensis]|uniref:caffeoyl-CoA O-methyltransferase-like n=1 Tax=Citrus sinensis TaxID=2711 RepID=UPI0003D71A60|nr:caffeoyl-CoA O-methyltransferase-like [Citrus sinensis]KAH9671870.1 Caffeoyl-CoA O-methyltransferase 1 [Citrus sinensis]